MGLMLVICPIVTDWIWYRVLPVALTFHPPYWATLLANIILWKPTLLYTFIIKGPIFLLLFLPITFVVIHNGDEILKWFVRWKNRKREHQYSISYEAARHELVKKIDKLNTDPVFLIGEVQKYLEKVIHQFRERFLNLQGQFKLAILEPREKAQRIITALEHEKGEAEKETPRDEPVIQAIEKRIAECRQVIEKLTPEETRLEQGFSEVLGDLEALNAHVKGLEGMKRNYQKRQDRLKRLADLGVEIEELQKDRSEIMIDISVGLGALRRRIGEISNAIAIFRNGLENYERFALQMAYW